MPSITEQRNKVAAEYYQKVKEERPFGGKIQCAQDAVFRAERAFWRRSNRATHQKLRSAKAHLKTVEAEARVFDAAHEGAA